MKTKMHPLLKLLAQLVDETQSCEACPHVKDKKCPADTGFMIRGCLRKYSKLQCKTLIKNHFIRKATAELKAKGGK